MTLGAKSSLGSRLEGVLGALSPVERARVEEELVKDAGKYVGLLKAFLSEGKDTS